MSSRLRGIGGSPGLVVGTAFVIGKVGDVIPRRLITADECPREKDRLRTAQALARAELRAPGKDLDESRTAGAILDAYALMIDDPALGEAIEGHITIGLRCAEWAVSLAIASFARRLSESTDAYLRERSRDIEFVGEHLLRAFSPETSARRRGPTAPSILVARDLSPVDTAGVGRENVLGFVTEGGSRTSHTSITARALRIPAVVGTQDALAEIATGDTLIVDGLRGLVIVGPLPEELEEAATRRERHAAFALGLHHPRSHESKTRDGVALTIRANVEIPEEAAEAKSEGASGVGLYRTEYLFIDRERPPSEAEQFEAFRSVLSAMPGRPVVLRTFDLGGDKFASTFKTPHELNPMLGLRAVRLARSRPEIFREHLRAMVRASAFGDVRIMVPMVASLPELAWCRSILDEVTEEVSRNFPVADRPIPLGVMIEVPSAAILADHFARHAAFMSIGTNDLIQYTLAVDRASRPLAHLASPFDPSLLHLIRGVVEAGARHDCPVSVCGAMAGDPLTALVLLGLGVREFSMEIAAMAEVRETFRRITLEEATETANLVRTMGSADDVEREITTTFAPRLQDILTGEYASPN